MHRLRNVRHGLPVRCDHLLRLELQHRVVQLWRSSAITASSASAQGEIPACVEACKVGALELGEINELVKAARTATPRPSRWQSGRFAGKMTPIPANVEAWHAMGLSVSQLNANGEKGA